MGGPLPTVPSTSTYDWEETPSSRSARGGKELGSPSGVPTFLGAAQGTGLSLSCPTALTGLDMQTPGDCREESGWLELTCGHLPQLLSPQLRTEQGGKNSCFSLRRETVGPHIRHTGFFDRYLRRWLLSLLSWSADWTQHIRGPTRLQRTTAAVWTSAWALNTVLSLSLVQNEQPRNPSSQLLLREGTNWRAYQTPRFFPVLPKGLASVSPSSERHRTWHRLDCR